MRVRLEIKDHSSGHNAVQVARSDQPFCVNGGEMIALVETNVATVS